MSATSRTALPVASPRQVRRAATALIRRDRRRFTAALVLNCLAVAFGLAGPWLLGRIIDAVVDGAGVAAVDRLALALVGCALAQLLLTRWAALTGQRFGERAMARVREDYVERALALPAATAERAGTGDLTARGSIDIPAVAHTVRDAGPQLFIAGIQVLFILGAVLYVSPLLAACGLLSLTGITLAARWYLRRARTAYLAEGSANSDLAGLLQATAAGARTVEALSLQERRIRACVAGIAASRRARERTLSLRSVLFPAVDVSHVLPVVAVLLVGGTLIERGAVSLGAVVAAAVYFRQLAAPLDAVLQTLESLQSSTASFARVEGLAQAPTARPSSGPLPDGDRIDVRGVRYAYDGSGGDVLHGIDLTVQPGERLALVGPSGAGKTTLGRLLAGVDAPRSGSVTVGGVPLADLSPERLRRQVVLVTQEHHVFLGTVRDNLALAAPAATDDELRAALTAVGAAWADDLPHGLDTRLGADGHHLDGVRTQQLALARIVLADPHTVILDEATALLDPATARHTEQALATVLKGRTVIAVAHRLHTAHDADRVAVMEDGRLTEIGPHDDLLAADGPYAALWHTWHGDPAPVPRPRGGG